MNIISHRGYWKTEGEKNTVAAFQRSFDLGFGTETDFRDSLGQLVVSHDPPLSGVLSADDFFRLYREYEGEFPLALNVKADGLQKMFGNLLSTYNIKNHFFFDMSVPDALQYIKEGLRVYTRQSEWETQPSFYKEAAGVWIDMFFGDWITEDVIISHTRASKEICLISPEIHGRDHRPFWERLCQMDATILQKVTICTDRPEEAKRSFS